MRIDPGPLVLCVLGYALYRHAGRFRRVHHAGPPGFASPPGRLLTTGPYAWSRNPMYLGHLVFLVGLTLATRSPIGALALVWQAYRLGDRVALDEDRLEAKFGDDYRRYVATIPRWI